MEDPHPEERTERDSTRKLWRLQCLVFDDSKLLKYQSPELVQALIAQDDQAH